RLMVESGIDADAVDSLVAIAADAGLVVAHERRLRTTVRAEEWLRAAVADRWVALASGFRDALPRGVRSVRGGWLPTASWQGAHPWDPAWPERSATLREHARLLGLIADDGSEPAWARPLRSGDPADAAELAAMLPTEVDRIFLQN